MSNAAYAFVAILLAGLLFWQFVSGVAMGTWWKPRIARQHEPKLYWFVLAVQSAILVVFLFTGKSWHIR